MKEKAIVLGAGIHGISCALAHKAKGFELVMIKLKMCLHYLPAE